MLRHRACFNPLTGIRCFLTPIMREYTVYNAEQTVSIPSRGFVVF